MVSSSYFSSLLVTHTLLLVRSHSWNSWARGRARHSHILGIIGRGGGRDTLTSVLQQGNATTLSCHRHAAPHSALREPAELLPFVCQFEYPHRVLRLWEPLLRGGRHVVGEALLVHSALCTQGP
jgi:hypothetical protein